MPVLIAGNQVTKRLDMSFAHLFTPHTIRGLELRNRIFSSSHQTWTKIWGLGQDDLAQKYLVQIESGEKPAEEN
jgi:hypothetical protein